MASQLHCRLPRWWRVLLIAAVLLASDAMKHPKRPLIRAKESERVPNSYFVHIKQSANPSKLNQIVRELNERSSQEGPFKASVSAIVTRAAYGFSTRLSPEALDYVSDGSPSPGKQMQRIACWVNFSGVCYRLKKYPLAVSPHSEFSTEPWPLRCISQLRNYSSVMQMLH